MFSELQIISVGFHVAVIKARPEAAFAATGDVCLLGWVQNAATSSSISSRLANTKPVICVVGTP